MMNAADLEKTYEAVARKIDDLGSDQSELFLAKLVLLLAHASGDVDSVQRYIHEAAASLERVGSVGSSASV